MQREARLVQAAHRGAQVGVAVGLAWNICPIVSSRAVAAQVVPYASWVIWVMVSTRCPQIMRSSQRSVRSAARARPGTPAGSGWVPRVNVGVSAPPAMSMATGRRGASVTTIRRQITQLGWATEQAPAKSEASERHVALDTQTTAVISAQRRRHDRGKEQAGGAWHETGFEFTNRDGGPLHPAAVTAGFWRATATGRDSMRPRRE